MKKMTSILLASSIMVSLSACATNISGTWQGRDATDDRPFSFGAVTFAPDGTYTAEAKYGDTIRAVTGTYKISDDEIMLYGQPFGERTYELKKVKDGLIFTDAKSQQSMTLDRFR